MSSSEAPLIQLNFAARNNVCIRDSRSKQKERSDVEGKFHLARLEFVGQVLFMYLTVKLNMFFWKIALDR